MWQEQIGPALRKAGHGTLAYNFRGQDKSPFAPGTALTPGLIVDDLMALLASLSPPNPILVGLSIGGLFAAQAIRSGTQASGLVLINTLRKAGPRLDWINAAMVKAVATGGFPLLLDMMLPMLVNAERLATMREAFLSDQPYAPMDPSHGHFNLMDNAGAADWDFPYESLTLPVLIMTGLKDRVFYDADDVAELTARVGDVRSLELPDAGHLIPAERPERSVDALIGFAAELADR